MNKPPMPDTKPLPAAELLRLADAAIKSAAEHILVLYPEGWADIEAYRAARAQSTVTAEERVILNLHLNGGRRGSRCHGCPCHEPQPPVVKDSLTAQPDHSGDANKMVCKWWQDEHGNWCCSCRATLPQFTPWRSLSPAGHNCPYCRAIIGVEPRYDEQIHTCGPFCGRPACVQRRTEDGEFRRTHDKP